MEAVIEVVQSLGSETYLHLAGRNHPLVARVQASDHFSVNQRVALVFDMQHAHFFNSVSGAAIA
jgi:ABC-type sugar transport system ATPase subunit